MNNDILKPPFPYFGGKSKIASVVWDYFHDIKHYNEPFFGSGAVLLQCPNPLDLVFSVNDRDGFVCNFWRAIKGDPKTVAKYADNHVNEIDLHARHVYMVNNRDALENKLLADPEYYDAKIAGWWAWGACVWIGSGWCSGKGCWNIVDGVFQKIPTSKQAVLRKLPHMGDKGKGVNKQLPHIGNKGTGVTELRTQFITEWMQELQDRMRHVRVCCGDWKRLVASPSVTTKHGVTGVFIDPPYTEGEYQYGTGCKSLGVAQEVNQWCVENGDNPLLRIVLCGVAEEHDNLLALGWSKETWKASKGYSLTKESQDKRKQEALWISPHCTKKETNND